MATITESLFGPSNRRRCAKGRTSYIESVDNLLSCEQAKFDDFNYDEQNCEKVDYPEIFEPEEIDEEPVTIDLSAFLQENPLLTETASENAVDSIAAVADDSHSQFRVTTSLNDATPILLNNTVLNNFDSSDPNIPLQLSDTHNTTCDPSLTVPNSNLSEVQLNSESPIKTKENICSTNKKSPIKYMKPRSPLGFSNPLKKYRNFSKVKDFIKNNIKEFGKYPVIKCEKLDIEKFAKKNNIKVSNWPPSHPKTYKKNNVNSGVIKRIRSKPISKIPKLQKPASGNKSLSSIFMNSLQPRTIPKDGFETGVKNIPLFLNKVSGKALSNVTQSVIKQNFSGNETIIRIVSPNFSHHQQSSQFPSKQRSLGAQNFKLPIVASVNKFKNTCKTYQIIAPKQYVNPVSVKPVSNAAPRTYSKPFQNAGSTVSPMKSKSTVVDHSKSPVKHNTVVPVEIMSEAQNSNEKSIIMSKLGSPKIASPIKYQNNFDIKETKNHSLGVLSESILNCEKDAINEIILQDTEIKKPASIFSLKKPVENQNLDFPNQNAGLERRKERESLSSVDLIVDVMAKASKTQTKKSLRSKASSSKGDKQSVSITTDSKSDICTAYNSTLNDILFGFGDDDFSEDVYIDVTSSETTESHTVETLNTNPDAKVLNDDHNEPNKVIKYKYKRKQKKQDSVSTSVIDVENISPSSSPKLSNEGHCNYVDKNSNKMLDTNDPLSLSSPVNFNNSDEENSLIDMSVNNSDLKKKQTFSEDTSKYSSTHNSPEGIDEALSKHRQSAEKPEALPTSPVSSLRSRQNRQTEKLLKTPEKIGSLSKQCHELHKENESVNEAVEKLPSPSANRCRQRRQSGRLLQTPEKSDTEIIENKSPNLPFSDEKRETSVTHSLKTNAKRNLSFKSVKGKKKMSKPADIIQEIKTITGGETKNKGKQAKRIPVKKTLSETSNNLNKKTKSTFKNKRKRPKTLKVLFKNPNCNKKTNDNSLSKNDLNVCDSNDEKCELSNNKTLTSTFRTKVVDKMGTPIEDGFEHDTNSVPREQDQVDSKSGISDIIENDIQRTKQSGISDIVENDIQRTKLNHINSVDSLFDTGATTSALSNEIPCTDVSAASDKSHSLEESQLLLSVTKDLVDSTMQATESNAPDDIGTSRNSINELELNVQSPLDNTKKSGLPQTPHVQANNESKLNTNNLENITFSAENKSINPLSEKPADFSNEQTKVIQNTILAEKNELNTANEESMSNSNLELNVQFSSDNTEERCLNQTHNTPVINDVEKNMSSFENNESASIKNQLNNSAVEMVEICTESIDKQNTGMAEKESNLMAETSDTGKKPVSETENLHSNFTVKAPNAKNLESKLLDPSNKNSDTHLGSSDDNISDTQLNSFDKIDSNVLLDISNEIDCGIQLDSSKSDKEIQLDSSIEIISDTELESSIKVTNDLQLDSSSEIISDIQLESSDEITNDIQVDFPKANSDIPLNYSEKINNDIQLECSDKIDSDIQLDSSDKINDVIQLESSNEIDSDVLSPKRISGKVQTDSSSENTCDIGTNFSDKNIVSPPNKNKDLNNQTIQEKCDLSNNQKSKDTVEKNSTCLSVSNSGEKIFTDKSCSSKVENKRSKRKSLAELPVKEKTCPKVKLSVTKNLSSSKRKSSKKWYISERKCSTDSTPDTSGLPTNAVEHSSDQKSSNRWYISDRRKSKDSAAIGSDDSETQLKSSSVSVDTTESDFVNDNSECVENNADISKCTEICDKTSTSSTRNSVVQSGNLSVPPIVIKEEPMDIDDMPYSEFTSSLPLYIKEEKDPTPADSSATVKKSKRSKKARRPFSPEPLKHSRPAVSIKIEEPDSKENVMQKSKICSPSTSSTVTPRGRNYSPEAVALPFTMGWMRELVHRANQDAGKKLSDVYYFAPDGKKLRSMPDVLAYLSKNGINDLSNANFTFSKNLIYREPFEIERDAKQKSVIVSSGKKKCSVSTPIKISDSPNKGVAETPFKTPCTGKSKKAPSLPKSQSTLKKSCKSSTEPLSVSSSLEIATLSSEKEPVKSTKKRGKQTSADSKKLLTATQIKSEPKSIKKSIKKRACDNSPVKKSLFRRSDRLSTTSNEETLSDSEGHSSAKKRKLSNKKTADNRQIFSSDSSIPGDVPLNSNSCMQVTATKKITSTPNTAQISTNKKASKIATTKKGAQTTTTKKSIKVKFSFHRLGKEAPLLTPCNRSCGITALETPMVECIECLCLFHLSCIPARAKSYPFICRACGMLKISYYAQLTDAKSSSSGPSLSDDEDSDHAVASMNILYPQSDLNEGSEPLKCLNLPHEMNTNFKTPPLEQNNLPLNNFVSCYVQSNNSPQRPMLVNSPLLLSHLTRPAICPNIVMLSQKGGPGTNMRHPSPYIPVASKPVESSVPSLPIGTRFPINALSSDMFPSQIFVQRTPQQGFILRTPPNNQVRQVVFSSNPVMCDTAGIRMPIQLTTSTSASHMINSSFIMPLQPSTSQIISNSCTPPLQPSTSTATFHIAGNSYRMPIPPTTSTTTSEIMSALYQLSTKNTTSLTKSCMISDPYRSVLNSFVLNEKKDYTRKVGTATRLQSASPSRTPPVERRPEPSFSSPLVDVKRFMQECECLKSIFKNLDVYGLLKASLVSKQWGSVAMQNDLWQQVSFQGLRITEWDKCCNALQKHGTRTLDLCDIILDNTNDPWKGFKTVIMKLRGVRELFIDKAPPSLLNLIATYMNQLLKLECFLTSAFTEPEIWSTPCELETVHLRSLSKLRTLSIKSLGGIILKDMSNYQMPYLPNLRYLSLTGFKFHTANNLKVLSQNQKLVSLELGDCCDIEPEIYEVLKQMPKLEKLRLENGGSLNDTGLPESLLKMEKLIHLELMNYKIPHTLPDALKQLVELVHLNVWPDNTSEGSLVNHNLFQAVSSCQRLKYLCWGIIAEEDAVPQVLEMKSSEHTDTVLLSFKELFDKLVELSSDQKVEVKCVPRSTWREFCNSRK